MSTRASLLLCAVICSLIFSLGGTRAGSVTPLAAVVDADGRLGFCDVLAGNSPSGVSWAQLAYNAGARTNRWEFRWDHIEPKPGQWDFSADDADVAASRGAGLDVEGIIDGIPKWGAAPGQPPGNGVPRGLGWPVHDSRNRWAGFVRGLVTHYRGQVKFWEIWNEPDLHFFWNGNAGDYYRTLQVAYRVIRSVDPSAQVVMAGMVVPKFTFLTQILDLARHDAAHRIRVPFDIVAWHAYGAARTLYQNIQRLHNLLNREGFAGMPIWVTEDGFPASNPQGEARQAAYVLQSIAYALAAGAQKVLIYRLADDSTGKDWGLISGTGSLRSGYAAFQVAATYFSHLVALVHAPTPTLERFELYTGTQRVTLIWDRATADQPFLLPAGQSTGTLVDWSGNESSVNGADGFFHLTAPGATYNTGVDQNGKIVGGPPMLIVEDNAAPSGLSSTSYLMPVHGTGRVLVLVNSGSAQVTAQITAARKQTLRASVSVPPRSVRSIDLDLLMGTNYGGMYSVSADGLLSALAASSGTTVTELHSATRWYIPAAPRTLVLTNPGSEPARIQLRAYTSNGRALPGPMLVAPAGGSVTWTRNAGVSGRLSLVIRSTGAVLPLDREGHAVSGAQLSWYVLHPQGQHLALFNPGGVAAHVDIHFVGSTSIDGEQIHIASHRSFGLGSHGARAVTVTADVKLTLGAAGATTLTTAEAGPATEAGMALGGPTTRADIFNPGTQPAHVTLSLVGSRGSRDITQSVAPGQIVAVRVRQAGDPPLGVLLQSDQAVVSVAAP